MIYTFFIAFAPAFSEFPFPNFLLSAVLRPTYHFLSSGQSFKFGSFGDGNGELNYPCYVAVNSQGHIIVSDMHSHRIQVCYPVYHFVYIAIMILIRNPSQMKIPLLKTLSASSAPIHLYGS